MANISTFPLVVQITGDNVSTSVVVGLGYTPTTAALVQATDANNNNVSANISSVVPGSSNVTINFLAAFSGTITVQLALSNATCYSSQLQPVTGTFWQTTQPVSGTITANQGTSPWVVSLPSTTITGSVAVTGTFFQATQPVSIASMPTTPVNFTQLNGVALGSPSNYGTSPGAVAVEGVNAFITNTPAVTISSGTVTTVSTVTAVTAVTTVTNPVKVEGNAGATLDAAINGAASTNALWVENAPATASAAACTATFINATGAAVNLKASAGNLYGLVLTNNQGATAFIEFFNTASAPTLGTTAVVFCIELPTGGIVTIPPATLALMNFTTGIGFASTTAENGSTTASVTGMIFFK